MRIKFSNLKTSSKIMLGAALAGAAATGGGVLAFAASQGLSTTNLGANEATVSACGDTLAASYTTQYDSSATGSGYKVTSVNLAGVTSSCNGKSATLELTGASGGLASSGPVTLATGNVNTFAISGVIDAKDVTGLSVVVSG